MKTMRKGKAVIRVPEDEVKDKLAKGYEFCPRSVWKKQVRDNDSGIHGNKKRSKRSAKSEG